MLRVIRLCLFLLLPTVAIGVPLGLMLGDYAKGEAATTRLAGYTKPDQGSNLRSASAADNVEPAAVSYVSYRSASTSSGFSY